MDHAFCDSSGLWAGVEGRCAGQRAGSQVQWDPLEPHKYSCPEYSIAVLNTECYPRGPMFHTTSSPSIDDVSLHQFLRLITVQFWRSVHLCSVKLGSNRAIQSSIFPYQFNPRSGHWLC